MKTIKRCILFLVVIMLVSCNNVSNKNGSSEYIDESTDEQEEYVYNLKSDKKYEDKKQLNIVIDTMKYGVLPHIDGEIINELNRKLDKDDYDFAVNFEIINPDDIATIDYYEQQLKNNKSVDIITTGYMISQDILDDEPDGFKCNPHDDTHKEYIDKKYFIPLNKYFHTQEGKKLYNQFPKLFWDNSADDNGEIYIVQSGINEVFSMSFDKKIAKKYGYDYTKFNGDIGSLENVLKKMKKESNVAGLYINPLYAPYNEYFGFSRFESGIYLNENTGKAENIFENKRFIKYANKVSEFYSKGYILDLDKDPENSENFLCMTNYFDTLNIYDDCYDSIISEMYINNKNISSGLGITSSSKYPDEAFQLLCLLYTNSEYATLLQCGIEGRNYTIKNDKEFVMNDEHPTFWYPYYELPANEYITNVGNEVEIVSAHKKQKLLKENFKHIKKSKAYGYSYPKSEKTEKIRKIYEKYEGLYYGAFKNVDETLKKANDELKKAGIDEVLTDVNRQLDEFYKDKISN